MKSTAWLVQTYKIHADIGACGYKHADEDCASGNLPSDLLHHLLGWVGENAPLLMHNVCRLLPERRRLLLDDCCLFQRLASRLKSRPVMHLPDEYMGQQTRIIKSKFWSSAVYTSVTWLQAMMGSPPVLLLVWILCVQ
jgi:hypothetical protein